MKSPFFKKGIKLTETQIDELVAILTKRCSHKTKVRIRSLTTYDLDTLIQNIAWFDRFHLQLAYDSTNTYEVHYCAGQSYPCEIKAIRNNILKKYP